MPFFSRMPLQHPVVEKETGTLTRPWRAWFDKYIKQLELLEFSGGEESTIYAAYINALNELQGQLDTSNIALFLTELNKLRSEQVSQPTNILHRLEALEKQ